MHHLSLSHKPQPATLLAVSKSSNLKTAKAVATLTLIRVEGKVRHARARHQLIDQWPPSSQRASFQHLQTMTSEKRQKLI